MSLTGSVGSVGCMQATGATDQTRLEAEASAALARGWGSATWRALGTSAQVVVARPDALDDARAAVERVLADVDLAASRFRADSELTALNQADGSDWLPVSPLLGRLLRVALDAAGWTGGAVDPTVGRSLVELGYDRTFRELSADGPALVVAVRPVPGWQQVELDDAAGRVRRPAGVLLDLGATAKGMASDLAAQAASHATGLPVLVNLGGDLRAIGAPDGGWPVLVTDSSSPELPHRPGEGQTLALHGGGLATSSTTARRWKRGGSTVHHLVDPASGLPVASPWRTASVTASTCVLANAASTGAMILGRAAPAWLTQRGLAARLVGTDGTVTTLPGWPGSTPEEKTWAR